VRWAIDMVALNVTIARNDVYFAQENPPKVDEYFEYYIAHPEHYG
jgi:hypothetical protein